MARKPVPLELSPEDAARPEAGVGPISWVLTKDDLAHLNAALATAADVVFDLETTGLDEHAVTGGESNGGVAARISLASFTVETDDVGDVEPTTYILPLSHPDSPWLGQWARVLAYAMQDAIAAARPLTGHNVKFDARWVYAHTGLDLSPFLAWDTQVSSHLLDENASTRLKERAPATFNVRRWDDHDLSYPGASEEVDLWELGEYAARDTYWTWRLKREHLDALFLTEDAPPPMDPEETMLARLGTLARRVAMPTVASLTRIEQNGMLLDVEWVRAEIARLEQVASEKMGEMLALYPDALAEAGLGKATPSTAATSKWFQAWSDAAVAAGDLRVTSLTPGGRPQWSKSVLTRQSRTGSEVAALVLAEREATKRLTYLRAWLGFVSPRTGAIHSTYHAGRVVTGRLSSSEPNMQQVTRALKPAFVPRDGHVLVELDYSQVELRVAAFVSRCEPMIAAFQRGEDLHRLLALRIVQDRETHRAAVEGRAPRVLTLDDVTPEDRQSGKSANFGLLYGMSPMGFLEYAHDAYGVELSVDEAERIHSLFFEMWDGMRQWHQRTVARVSRDGYVTSPIGRVRRLPGIWSPVDYLSQQAERNAINSPVQGFASDLMQMAAASIQGLLPGTTPVPGARLVGTVHDSIVGEFPADRWEEVSRACIERMTTALDPALRAMGCVLDVPLAVEATAGTRWGLYDVGVIEG